MEPTPMPTFCPPLARATALLAVAMLVSGCGLHRVARGDANAAAARQPGHVLVAGRINYVIDGRVKAPYGAFRPAWPAPFVSATRLETGDTHASPAVADADGAFVWELPPGHYVISRIGCGTFSDDTYIAWPRVAFRVPADAPRVYLGHLRLLGTSYREAYTDSAGKPREYGGVRYRFEVVDEGARQGWKTSPMFVRGDMPIGESLLNAWRASREATIARIFGAPPR
ncbi:hypothetical protein AVW16_03180 [Crenobacter luteus]|uniref:Uncharacterized protein n=2 Tax=Crenobacter luteus TaxID=1452487 RepID=A0A165EKX3_9NEIS|nr:hypothetical protein AVW16_03180 [Crenobacter luteus]